MSSIEERYVQNEGIKGVDTPTLVKGGDGGMSLGANVGRNKPRLTCVHLLKQRGFHQLKSGVNTWRNFEYKNMNGDRRRIRSGGFGILFVR